MKPVFRMMVGISGSGKSAFVKKLAEVNNAVIIESDAYREKLYGSSDIQGDNGKLFEAIHQDIFHHLGWGVSVIFDATNISYKNRISVLQKLSKLDIRREVYVMATEYSICLERNAKRERKVPEYVIKRMRENFTMPQYNEGWDSIMIEYEYEKAHYNLLDYLKEIQSFGQNTPYHTHTLGEHTKNVFVQVCLNSNNPLVGQAAILHDNGKRYTKVFRNARGESSEIAHYYNHEGCGAYEALFYLNNLSVPDMVYVCGLIQYHMRPYMAKTERAVERLKSLVGEKMFSDLMILHEADKKGH